MRRWLEAGMGNQRALFSLHVGQSAIIGLGVAAIMLMAGDEGQRIAIAKAILKSPPILIFDEATSALDSDSEHAIQPELDRLSMNRTTLIIAHWLSTIVRAHAIVVMDCWRIVERGSHKELLRKQCLYAWLWLLQQREDETAQ